MTSAFDPGRWPEFQALFDALVDLPADEQTERLVQIGTADADLRRVLERLLAADSRVGPRLQRLEALLATAPEEDSSPPADVYDLVGRSVSHFHVLQPLARGGMGVVYRAEDVQLGRVVALKFPLPDRHLDPAIKDRFRHEARAAAALDHPNICNIYEVGETEAGQLFIAMAVYEGETLRDRLRRNGRLRVEEAVGIARQIAQGLEAAHRKNIVHRDLKPANVMLLPDGAVKILDFGLAKVQDLTLTTSRAFLGTVSYMAPEQIRGDPVDARTDLWALGVVLFEMLTGKRPFAGEHEASVGHAILHTDPEAIAALGSDAPPALARLVSRLLQKELGARCVSAAEVISALDAPAHADVTADVWTPGTLRPHRTRLVRLLLVLGSVAVLAVIGRTVGIRQTPAAPGTASLLVLPLEHGSGDSGNEHLVAGLTEELVGLLGTVEGLKVVSGGPASAERTAAADVRPIALTFGATTVLRGVVKTDSSVLLVTAELVSADDGDVLWTATLHSNPGELLAVRDEIVTRVTAALGLGAAASAPDLADSRRTDDREAYDLYLRGRHSWRTRSREGLEGAVAYYEQAIERDPSFVLPHAGLAEAYVNLSNYGHRPAGQALALARVAADRALVLEPDIAEAHASKGYVLASTLEFRQAEAAFQRALVLNPNYTWGRHYYTLLLLMLGRTEPAREQNRAVLELDPLSLPANTTRGIILSQLGDLTAAQRELQRALTLAPSFPLTLFYLGAVFAAQDSTAAALRTLEDAAARAPDFPGVLSALAYVYRRSGQAAAADSLIEQLRQRATDARGIANLAFAYGAMGRLEDAFPLLEQLEWDVPSLIALRADPLLQALRRDSRYVALLRRIGTAP